MLRFGMLAALGLILSGCLTTTKPVFDQSNSIAAADSSALLAYVEAWERMSGPQDSPRALIEAGARVVEISGMIVVEERKESGAEYYSMALVGGRPMACFAHDAKMQEIADRHGVALTIDRDEDDSEMEPVAVKADGTKDALYGFVMDAFRVGTLSCTLPPDIP